MNGIFYFSGTGNSLWLAKKVKESLGGEIRYIPNWNGDISAYDKLIIVCPVYSFGLPLPVFDFMKELNSDAPLWIVMNYGGAAGKAASFAYNHAKSCGLNIKNVYTMKMPENFTAVFSTPLIKPYNKGLLKKAPKAIGKIIASIEKNEEKAFPSDSPEKHKLYNENKSNWGKMGERFSTSSACTLCGKCVNNCPAENIAIKDGKVIFGNNCVVCQACYHRCPSNAVQYLGKPNKMPYFNPNVPEKEMGTDIVS
ncbi:MAG: EFR1 family ferrodoxin [Ruminiclostridium sp.]|nr:EFR1 family ferrodoxin [Ruminiclostridium sp.]